MMYFPRLRDLREDRDKRQQDIADMLGIQQTVYSRYERGFQTIPLEHLIRLADYYDVSLDYLTGRTNAISHGKYDYKYQNYQEEETDAMIYRSYRSRTTRRVDVSFSDGNIYVGQSCFTQWGDAQDEEDHYS